jgi:ATP-dependent Clp protease ATP-binding subunit ClpC
VDELIVFHALSEEEIRKITDMMLKQVADRLEEQEIQMTWDEAVTAKLAEDGYDPKYGARPLRRLIQRTVEDTLSEELLQGRVSLGREVRLTVKDGQITLGTSGSDEDAGKAPDETEKTAAAEMITEE